MKTISKKKILIWSASVLLMLAILIGGCGIYVSDYYRADYASILTYPVPDMVPRIELEDGIVAYGRLGAENGFIFYPGGKVECKAYEPLMLELASRGILCVLVEMPFNLAVLDINAADGIAELYPKVENWYIGGHSLGGSMAASYAEKNSDSLRGLVLLAAYSTADISTAELRTISVYGSEDGVMNREKYDKYKGNLPASLCEIVIDGGCHAYFGMYGEQKGDGTPSICPEEQIRVSADHIADFILEGEK